MICLPQDIEQRICKVDRTEHQLKMMQVLFKQQNTDKVIEYINEAEHQDGVEFWDSFDSESDVLYDFNLYVCHSNPF